MIFKQLLISAVKNFNSFVVSIFSFISLLVLSYLFGMKKEKEKQNYKNLQKELKNANMRQKIDEDISHISDDELHKQLHEYEK